MNVGISFQIRDDELDLADDSVPVSASKSQSQNWPSIPIIYLKEHGSKGAFEKYRQIQKDGAARSELITLLRTEGIVDRLEAVKKFHLNLALEAAQNFRNSGEMAALASHAIHRNT